MEFIAHKNTLMLALSRAKRVVEKKTTMPILSNVLVETEASDTITVKATDLDQALAGTYEVDVEQGGAFCLPAALFHDVVRHLPDGNVRIKYNPETRRVEIYGEKESYYELNTVPVEDYPVLPSPEDVQFVSVSADVLSEGLSFVLPSAATDDPRVYLNSVYFETKASGKLRFVATDGHKLALYEKQVTSGIQFPSGLIVPRKSAAEILSLLEEPGEEEVELGFSRTHLFFRKKGLLFSCRLIDSTYPNYEVVIPTSYNYEVAVNRDELREAMKRTAVLATQIDKNPRLKFEFEPGRLTVSASSVEYGASSQPVPINYEGKAFKLGFPYQTLNDVISVFEQDTLIFRIANAETPVKIDAEGFEEGFGIVMPVAVDDE